jgi:outer membrane cobalamin receptor
MMLASSAAFASPGADPSAPPTGAAAVKPAAKAAPAVQAKRSKSKGNRGEPLVVTGSLIPQRPETGKSVAMADPALQIIDRKTIERSGAGDLRRLLTRTVAGVR